MMREAMHPTELFQQNSHRLQTRAMLPKTFFSHSNHLFFRKKCTSATRFGGKWNYRKASLNVVLHFLSEQKSTRLSFHGKRFSTIDDDSSHQMWQFRRSDPNARTQSCYNQHNFKGWNLSLVCYYSTKSSAI